MKPYHTPVLSTIWGTFAVLAVMAMIFAGANIVLIGILATAAVVGTAAVVTSNSSDSSTSEDSAREKAKNDFASSNSRWDQAGMRDLLELLDEDDLRDLRQRIKRRVIDAIEMGSDGELSTLDALLAEQQLQKRK